MKSVYILANCRRSLVHCTAIQYIKRSLVDAYFVLSLGAKVNNNKLRVSVVYTNPRGRQEY